MRWLLVPNSPDADEVILTMYDCLVGDMVMFSFLSSMMNGPPSSPVPMPYVTPLLKWPFCAVMLPTIPGASAILISVLSSTMYQFPKF